MTIVTGTSRKQLNEHLWPGTVEFCVVHLWPMVLGLTLLVLAKFPGREWLWFALGAAGLYYLFWVQKRFRRQRSDRLLHLNGLIYRVWKRWASAFLSIVPVVAVGVMQLRAQSSRPNDLELEYTGDPKRTEARGDEAFESEAAAERARAESGQQSRFVVAPPEDQPAGRPLTPPATTAPVPTTSPSHARAADVGAGLPPVISWIPPEDRGKEVSQEKREQDVKEWKKRRFGIGDLFLPLAIVKALFGIGGSTEYREVTLKTIHEIHKGGGINPNTRSDLIKQLSVLTAAQRAEWLRNAEAACDEMPNLDDAQKAAARKSLREAVMDAGGTYRKDRVIEERADSIVANMRKAAADGALNAAKIEKAMNDVVPDPSDDQKEAVRTRLATDPSWDSNYRQGWSEYVKPKRN